MQHVRHWWMLWAGLALLPGCHQSPPQTSSTAPPQPAIPLAPQSPSREVSMQASPTTFLGLRTASLHVSDLAAAKAWYTRILGVEPYFDQPFYVGFNVGGFELGIQPWEEEQPPTPSGPGSPVTYWGVPEIEPTLNMLLEAGATARDPIQDVGDGIKVASVTDPFGNVLGIIENRHFPNSAQPNTIGGPSARQD